VNKIGLHIYALIGLLGISTVLQAAEVSRQDTYPVPGSTNKITYIGQTFQTIDGLTLHGHLAIPASGKGPFPAVLLLVGSGAGDRYENMDADATTDGKPALLFQPIEAALIAKGIAVFAYDKRGIRPTDNTFLNVVPTCIAGASTCDPTQDLSKLIFISATAENLAKDAQSAYDFMKTLPQVDPSKVGVLGHSEGTLLAMEVAENRSDVRAIFALGLWTRAFQQIIYNEEVTDNLRLFYLIDANQDGYITQDEAAPFEADQSPAIDPWPTLLSNMDLMGEGKISEQDWSYYWNTQYRAGMAAIKTPTSPLPLSFPTLWWQQMFAMGPLLPRWQKQCGKVSVFQGEVDAQTPFEDALELKASCSNQRTPLRSFKNYPDLGHAFSPRVGLKNWRDTEGPLSPSTALDIATEAASVLN
jgi:pimeloyl-ACP methyl ester carboxylesterase